MNPPINGMKIRPYGDDIMAPAFLDCILYSGNQNNLLEAFKNKTGHNLLSIVEAKGLSKMIDEATGRTKEAIIAFADWVAENIWGIEE